MSDEPRKMSKQDVAKEWANESLPGDQMLRFALRVGDQVVQGREVPMSGFTAGDMTDRTATTEEFLTRLMGVLVKIETGDE